MPVPREPIERFAELMEGALQWYDEKRGQAGWRRDCSYCDLHAHLIRHVRMLDFALAYNDDDGAGVIHKCVDVANFAMMIADKIKTELEATCDN
jgi:hypothetical protein